MIAFNHALTGAVIGLSLQRPMVALPVALCSHFVCDAIPHYGSNRPDTTELKRSRFTYQLLVDAVLCIGLVALLLFTAPTAWFLAGICAFVATLPDFAWLPGFLRVRRGGNFEPAKPNGFMIFAARIQWFSKPIGALVELVWAAAAILILLAYL